MRKVIHVDCDCFFAAVEMRDNPELNQVPMAIGGRQRRGVISTCNYPARSYGVRSAMPVAYALKLCPALVLMPSRMALYKQVSNQVMDILPPGPFSLNRYQLMKRIWKWISSSPPVS